MVNTSLVLCHNKSKCSRCDIGYIIKDYVLPLIQLLTQDLKDYNMQFQTTKCLNTSVMLMLLMAGKKGVHLAKQCDSSSVITRHELKKDNNVDILSSLKRNVLSTNFKLRKIYYVLLSDGFFVREDHTKIYFPGHVFLLEKYREGGKIYFNIYQSYINAYDLKGHFERMAGSVRLTYNEAAALLQKLSYVVLNDTWDKDCTEFWRDITFVDESRFEGFRTTNKICACYRSLPLKYCLNNIKKYIKDVLKNIEDRKPCAHQSALSIAQLKEKLHSLLDDITLKSV